ncbi:hypothetical protein AYY19_08565 [Photobacterium aquimaris]|uniref:EpsG family protein n=1 Tax=Photobacterium aquimaris TaxID=512643 RepID=UPI0007EFC48F|nr:EpsG family protein [Photobacterium aquimaris]OBU11952.1 hypothetical protein AYY19_08565 [Photobacterium aquimaris]PSW01988.1 hypothetical protein CTM91_06860 [Photobacterium aquimaris]
MRVIYLSLSFIYLLTLFLLAYFPIGAYFFSFVIVSVIAITKFDNQMKKQSVFFLTLFFLIITIIVNEVSVQRFLNFDDDFTTYYNNYLSLLNGNIKDLFYFGGGFEVGLPIINLFLTKIIDGPYPYVIQLFFVFLFVVFTSILVKKNTIFKSDNKFLLLIWALLFFKITLMLTIERQAISSFFVLLAVFSLTNTKKVLFLIIGSLFHLSAVVVYFLVNMVLKVRSFKIVFKIYLACLICLPFSSFLLQAIYDFFPNDKIGYVIYHINNKELIINEFVKSIKQVIYVSPLIFLAMAFKIKGNDWKLFPSLLLFVLLMLVFSMLPGVPTRIFMPIVFFLYGFYYYDFFCSFTEKNQVLIIILFSLLFTIYKVIIPGYYLRYPMVETTPFYYINDFFQPQGNIQRGKLPKSIIINNENKL